MKRLKLLIRDELSLELCSLAGMKSCFFLFLVFVAVSLDAQDCRVFIDVGDCSEFDSKRGYLYKDSTTVLLLDYECIQGEIDSIVLIANGQILDESDYETWTVTPEESGSILCEAILFQNGEQHLISQQFNVVAPPLLEIRALRSESDPSLITVELMDRTGKVINSKFTTCFCEYSIFYKDGSVEDVVSSDSLTIPTDELDKIKEIKVNGILVLSKQYNRTQWVVKGKSTVRL